MFAFKATKKQRLITIIGISFTFFIAEISIGFYTKSLALVADAFHYVFKKPRKSTRLGMKLTLSR